MKKTTVTLLALLFINIAYSQDQGYFFSIMGDFDGDDKDEMLLECYTNKNQQKLNKIYSPDDFDPENAAMATFTSREKNIPAFVAAANHPHAGFALLHTIGDLDNDGGEEVGYVIQWLDHSNLNTYHIISLKNGYWKELYRIPIREYQLPPLPQAAYNRTPFGNTITAKKQLSALETFRENQKREKALEKFDGFVKKLSLFNILVRFYNNIGLEAYTLWNLKSGDKEPNENLPPEESFLVFKDKVKVPTFTLDIQVSPEVAKVLQAKKEQIVVNIMLHGEPKKQLDQEAKKYLGDYKAKLYLAEFVYKLDKAGKLVIDDKHVPRIAFENLKNPNYYMDVNVFSSRKTYKTNIFDSNHVGGKIKEISNKTHKIYIKMLK